jgi:hypothetical protein
MVTLPILGTTTLIELINHADKVPAKIDTGADSSSMWASDVNINKKGVLSFTLFGPSSPFYTGEVITRKAYNVALVRSSSGHEQIRYRTEFPVRINGKRIRVLFNLSNRSNNAFPVLIGRRTLAGKFVVDVSQREYTSPLAKVNRGLNKEMQKDPHAFYKKYYRNLLEK